MGVVLCAILLLAAWIYATTTVYTLTSKRIVMRIGAALTMSLNLPYKWIAKADLAVHGDGTGSIHLDLKGQTRISYLLLWPHVRPWKMNRAEPTLRAIPDAETVARILGQAAEAEVEAITADMGTDLPTGLAVPAE